MDAWVPTVHSVGVDARSSREHINLDIFICVDDIPFTAPVQPSYPFLRPAPIPDSI